MKNIVVLLAAFFLLSMPVMARDLLPNKTHAVLTVTYTNFDDVPQAKKRLVFIGQKNPKNKVSVVTDEEGEVTFHIPREETYTIFCESITGLFECGNTPYVSPTASTGGITVAFDDTRVELKGVNFKAGSAELEPESMEILDAAVAGIKRNPKARIEIQGHTSSEGDENMNQTLSEQRAYAVFLYMTSKGIDRGRLSASGYGSSQPKADNSTEAGRIKNRRIELRVLNDDEVEVEVK
ncbi:OmpA family protein [uncultured Fibrobacter sp.]|uniref:OmpA family protein n=1 Tax=uncultured Fibrobacter sp. TaxID=261512 RepID=UPI00260FB91C|nr:OmpA family protein [uncultured Fibrobacter sp.]